MASSASTYLTDTAWRYRTVSGGLFTVALGVAAVATVRPGLAALAVPVLGLTAWVYVRPQLAAYLVIGLTPLIVGIDRGRSIPLLRPSEALALSVGLALLLRSVIQPRSTPRQHVHLSRVEVAIVLLAITSSVMPLTWMLARQVPISHDDLLYALVMWKYAGIYLIVRASVTTAAQAIRCLQISVAASCVVAAIAILQSLQLLGVSHLLATYYAPFGYTGALSHARGSSTLSLPAATADLLIYNLAIVAGLWIWMGSHRAALSAISLLLAMGAISAGEFSSAIGLVIGVCAIAFVTSYPRLLSIFVPFGGIALVVLRPVIQARLSGFDSVSGLPVSWAGRLANLRGYFWPRLFADWNYVLGVQPSARVPVAFQATGYVWIESGYTWLLWGGGIPLLASFGYFVTVSINSSWREARRPDGPFNIAALAVVVSVTVMAVLMIFDPHLTYRGAAEEMFALLALSAVLGRANDPTRQPAVGHNRIDVEANACPR
ncbi:MAG: hypothetical protein ABI232_06610 [Jatrophihabitantaceae bacterium]